MPLERVIWGPPGTGKTSSAITLVRNWMDAGTDPTNIAFLAFTKAAAMAAASKVLKNEDEKEMSLRFPYFRTVHSLCWRGLHKNRPDVRLIGTGDMKQFAKVFSMDGAYSVYDWEDLAEVYAQMKNQGRTEWDTALAAYQMTRVKAESIEDLDKARKMPNTEGLMMLGVQNMGLNIYQEFVEKYERFKAADGLIDFTDMLEYGVREMPAFDDIRYVLLDECVPAGTRISMADGSKKKIEEIGLGEKVLGFDHRVGRLVPAEVVETRSKLAHEIVILNETLCLTPNHPVFVVGKGYVESGKVSVGDQIVTVNGSEDLPWLRPGVLLPAVCGKKEDLVQDAVLDGLEDKTDRGTGSGDGDVQELWGHEGNEKILQSDSQILLRQVRLGLVEDGQSFSGEKVCISETRDDRVAHVYLRGLREGKDRHREPGAERQAVLQPSVCGKSEIFKRGFEETLFAHEEKQSDEGSGGQGKNEAEASGAASSPSLARGEWKGVDETSGDSPGEAGGRVAAGSRDGDRGVPRVEVGQAGYRESKAEDRGGGGRRDSQKSSAAGDRPAEGGSPEVDGVDESQVLEQGDPRRFGFGCKVHTVRSVKKIRIDVRVFNIGTRTENYFAEGVLVHNCQDLAGIHHLLIDRILSNSEEIWWIGDDDQAIFKFSGASAELFLERAKRSKVQIQLRQTRRFGQNIVDFSNQIISRVAHRHPKEIIGVSGREGAVKVTGAFEPIPGDVMILHRHVFGCLSVAQAYIDAGLPFRNERGLDPLRFASRIKMWQTIQELAEGKTATATAIELLVEDGISSHIVEGNQRIDLLVRGAKGKLEGLKGSLNLQDLVQAKLLTGEGARVIAEKRYDRLKFKNDFLYFDRLAQNGYEVGSVAEGKIPRITTIHGAKGRQAEQVVVFSEMSGKCWDDYETEHRLAYVAATRTETDVNVCVESRLNWAKDSYDYPIPEGSVEFDGSQGWAGSVQDEKGSPGEAEEDASWGGVGGGAGGAGT